MKKLTPAFVTLIMLLVVGLLIGLYVFKTLWATEETAPEADMRAIPMATVDLEPGTVITESHLGNARVNLLDFTDEADRDIALNSDVLIGRVVRNKITAAQPIHSTDLYGPGERPPLKLGMGMRAATIVLGDSSSVVDGWVKDGDFVDAHITVSANGDRRLRGGQTITLMKGVKVLAVNRGNNDRIDRGGNTVTLELTPAQANVMFLAENSGDLSLSYNPHGKGDGGVTLSDEDRATLEEILALKPLEEPKKPFRTEHYRGSGYSILQFDEDNSRASGGPGSWLDDDDFRQRRAWGSSTPSGQSNPTDGPTAKANSRGVAQK